MPSRILVTGATGYIGRHVVPALLERGHAVVTSSRHDHADLPWRDDVEHVPYDLDAPAPDPYERFGRPDCVLHLAWDALDDYRSADHIERILPAHIAFLRELIVGGAKDLLVTGTCLEYGAHSGALHEALPPDPDCAYGIAKDTLRRYIRVLQHAHPVRLRWMRLFYSYGPGQRARSLLSLLAKAVADGDAAFPMSGGEQLRDYLPVEQLAGILADVATQNHTLGVINACSGTPISIRTLVERHMAAQGWSIELELGHYPYPDWEPLAFWGNDAKLRRALGEAP